MVDYNFHGNLLLGLVAAVAVAITLFAMASLFWVTRRRSGLPDFTPPVTIYKPLKGLDEGLEENLRSFFGSTIRPTSCCSASPTPTTRRSPWSRP